MPEDLTDFIQRERESGVEHAFNSGRCMGKRSCTSRMGDKSFRICPGSSICHHRKRRSSGRRCMVRRRTVRRRMRTGSCTGSWSTSKQSVRTGRQLGLRRSRRRPLRIKGKTIIIRYFYINNTDTGAYRLDLRKPKSS